MIDESKFDRSYIAPHLQERVRNWKSLTIGERLSLTSELSVAAWAKIGVVHDPDTPGNRTIRKVTRANDPTDC